ncbi:Neuromedin-K receptor, partial [Lamellibrachia satsuma]
LVVSAEIHCKLDRCLPVFSITCSIYSMAALAEERYRAIVVGPVHTIYRKRALKIIGGIWILSSVVATPTFFDYSVHPGPMTSQDVGNTTAETSLMLCKPTYDIFDKVNGVFILCASYMIPQAFIFSRYCRLVTFIKRQGHQTPGGLTSSIVSQNRTRIIKMLIIIVVLFSFAWLPYFVLLVGAKMTGQSSSAEATGGFVLVQLTLAVFSTSYNIVLYLVYNAEFRKSFLSIFCCVRLSTVHPSLPPVLPVTPQPPTVPPKNTMTLVPR